MSMAKEEFVLFISREAILDGTGEYATSYRLARRVDVHGFHIEMIEHHIGMGKRWEHDEAFGFLFTDIDEVNDDEDIERGRLEAKRIFVSVTDEFPFTFLNGNETHVISNVYTTTID